MFLRKPTQDLLFRGQIGFMADSADELLRAIARVYRRWLAGTLPEEDALFEIGDLLAMAPEMAEGRSPPSGDADPGASS
jgi:hypothetical protein